MIENGQLDILAIVVVATYKKKINRTIHINLFRKENEKCHCDVIQNMAKIHKCG